MSGPRTEVQVESSTAGLEGQRGNEGTEKRRSRGHVRERRAMCLPTSLTAWSMGVQGSPWVCPSHSIFAAKFSGGIWDSLSLCKTPRISGRLCGYRKRAKLVRFEHGVHNSRA